MAINLNKCTCSDSPATAHRVFDIVRMQPDGAAVPVTEHGDALCEFCTEMLWAARLEEKLRKTWTLITDIESGLGGLVTRDDFDAAMKETVTVADVDEKVEEAIQDKGLMSETEVDSAIETAIENADFVSKNDFDPDEFDADEFVKSSDFDPDEYVKASDFDPDDYVKASDFDESDFVKKDDLADEVKEVLEDADIIQNVAAGAARGAAQSARELARELGAAYVTKAEFGGLVHDAERTEDSVGKLNALLAGTSFVQRLRWLLTGKL